MNFKELIIFDLVLLRLTELSVIAHDSNIFKNIADLPIDKIMELYNQSEKQIFIAFDKEDIVTIAKKIDTYEISILPYEDCCTTFVAKHPVTKPRVDVIRRSEKALADKIDEMVEAALASDEIIEVE